MSENEFLSDEQREVEALLGSLVPKQPEIDVPALMVRAWQESVLAATRRQVRRWQAAALVLSVGVLILGTLVIQTGVGEPNAPVIAQNHPEPAPPAEDPHTPSELKQSPQLVQQDRPAETSDDVALDLPPRGVPGWWSSLWTIQTSSNSVRETRERWLRDDIVTAPVDRADDLPPAPPLMNTPASARELLDQELRRMNRT